MKFTYFLTALFIKLSLSFTPYNDQSYSVFVNVSDFAPHWSVGGNPYIECYADYLLVEVTIQDINVTADAYTFLDLDYVCSPGDYVFKPLN